MTKNDLISIVADKAVLSKSDATKAVMVIFDAIAEDLAAGEKVSIPGFGVFSVKDRNARTGINPATGEKIEIPATKAVSFKAGKALKETINK